MKTGRAILIAIALSLLIHGIFFAMSPHIVLKGMSHVMDQTRKIFRIRDVSKETDKVNLFTSKKNRTKSVRMSKKGLESGDLTADNMFLKEDRNRDKYILEKQKRINTEKIDKVLPDKNKDIDILKNEENKAREDASFKKRSLADELLKTGLVSSPDRVDVLHGKEGNGYAADNYDISVHGESGIVSENYDTDMFQSGMEYGSSPSAGVREGDYQDISRFLDVDIIVYKDVLSGENFFKLIIKVKDKSSLEIIPKEIIFLVDSSKSITEKKLEYIKEGVSDSLENLNPQDCFNLVAFRGDLVKFRDASVPVTERNIYEARKFIRELEAVGQTDVEQALLGIINEPFVFNPSYILLSTDGRPTTGVMDSRMIIQEITRHNRMERPIFCFGGGRRVNKYLLDFISYQNRGWSRFSFNTYDMRDDFNRLCSEVNDPILLDVRYLLAGIDPREVYPKYLSDFYRGKPFELYGKFRDEDVFSMQLLGEVNGSTKEFIFKRSLKNDSKPGDVEIARSWAFRKIYYLISRNTMGLGDPRRLKEEINRLSRMYNIITPYDIEDNDGG